MSSIWDVLNQGARFADFRRSENIEDRRKEKIIPGVFGDADPDVYGPTADWSGISKPWWGTDEPPVQRTSAGKALGLDELERAALDQEQNNQVRDALDNAPVAIPGQDFDSNGPPVRINNRARPTPVPLMSVMDIIPVDHDPFNSTGPRWERINHDPFK